MLDCDIVFLPIQIASELHPGTATSATWRLAIALLSVTRQRREFYVDKPRVAILSGVRMDNAEKLLAPVRVLPLPDGSLIFDSIVYEPGIRKSLAGQITVTLTPAAAAMISGAEIEIDDTEFARYSHATALTLRMRAGAEQYRRGHKSVRWRLGIESATELLGPSILRAGEQRGTVSLARAWSNGIAPAVVQLNDVSKAFRVTSTITKMTDVPGSPWISVDLDVYPVSSMNPHEKTPRKSLSELAQIEAYRSRVRDNF